MSLQCMNFDAPQKADVSTFEAMPAQCAVRDIGVPEEDNQA